MRLLKRKRIRSNPAATVGGLDTLTEMEPDGAVRSVQAGSVEMPQEQLDELWSPMHLERLARTYWRYLSRVTFGLIRVHYTDRTREVVLITRPFVLLRFHAPDYEMSAQRGIVRWRINDGLLVARRHHGHLEIQVERRDSPRPGVARLHLEVEVANFYPALAHFVARWFYVQTQSRIHVLVTHGFLRSLARLELEESRVGRFRTAPEPAPPPVAGEDVTVGDSSWGIAAAVGIAAAMAVALGLLLRVRR